MIANHFLSNVFLESVFWAEHLTIKYIPVKRKFSARAQTSLLLVACHYVSGEQTLTVFSFNLQPFTDLNNSFTIYNLQPCTHLHNPCTSFDLHFEKLHFLQCMLQVMLKLKPSVLCLLHTTSTAEHKIKPFPYVYFY